MKNNTTAHWAFDAITRPLVNAGGRVDCHDDGDTGIFFPEGFLRESEHETFLDALRACQGSLMDQGEIFKACR